MTDFEPAPEGELVPEDPNTRYGAFCDDCSFNGLPYDNPEQADYERQQHLEQEPAHTVKVKQFSA